MSISQYSILLGGLLSLLMALFHYRFPAIFRWGVDLPKVSALNQRVFYTVHLALLFVFVMFSFLSFAYSNELAECSGLACAVTLSYSLFWLWRTIWQIVYFKPGKKKKSGKMTSGHYTLIVVFAFLWILYFIPFIHHIIM